jgi:ABC-type Fe3+ transport system permease subunit
MSDESSPALPAFLIVLLISSTVFAFGYLKARMDQANQDYKDTVAKVPKLRKAFWAAWWGAVKVGFWVFVAGFLLVAWVIHDARGADAEPHPSPSVGSVK